MYKSTENTSINNVENYDYKKRLLLQRKINTKLDKKEFLEIFKILLNNKIPYTQNNNGVFFNLKYIEDSILEQIEDYVNYCLDNRKKKLYQNNNTYKDMNFKKNTQNNYTSLTKIYETYSIANKIIKNNDDDDTPEYNLEENNSNKIMKCGKKNTDDEIISNVIILDEINNVSDDEKVNSYDALEEDDDDDDDALEDDDDEEIEDVEDLEDLDSHNEDI